MQNLTFPALVLHTTVSYIDIVFEDVSRRALVIRDSLVRHEATHAYNNNNNQLIQNYSTHKIVNTMKQISK